MTELEYDEAQRLGLPSYIFILDEQIWNQGQNMTEIQTQVRCAVYTRKSTDEGLDMQLKIKGRCNFVKQHVPSQNLGH